MHRSIEELGASVGEVAHTQEAFGCEQSKCDGEAVLYGAESVERGKSTERCTGALSELVQSEMFRASFMMEN